MQRKENLTEASKMVECFASNANCARLPQFILQATSCSQNLLCVTITWTIIVKIIFVPQIFFSLQQIINSIWFKFVQLIAGTKIVTQTPDVTQNKYLW